MPLSPCSLASFARASCARPSHWFPRILLMCIAAGVLAGCASSIPYRTAVVEKPQHFCEESTAATDMTCAHLTPEISKETPYELHFVEFDDQGWLHAATVERGQAQLQLDRVMSAINEKLAEAQTSISSCSSTGGSMEQRQTTCTLRQFRRLLAGTSESEAATGKREVVGIYVGWRGRPWDLPGPILNLSFWSRKAAALRVLRRIGS